MPRPSFERDQRRRGETETSAVRRCGLTAKGSQERRRARRATALHVLRRSRSYVFAMSPWNRSFRTSGALADVVPVVELQPLVTCVVLEAELTGLGVLEHENVAVGPKKAAIQTSVNPQSAAVQRWRWGRRYHP
jgi:hypothetical protein